MKRRNERSESKFFNRTRCIQNIIELLTIKNKKLGYIEELAGNAPGYLSRMRSGTSNADPSIEFLLAAANELDVSLDVLVSSEIKEITETEKYLYDFINMLVEDTKSHNISWSCKSVIDFDTWLRRLDFYNKVKLCEDLYYTKLPDGRSSIFIIICTENSANTHLKENKFYQICISDSFNSIHPLQPVCNTLNSSKSLGIIINNLVKQINLYINYIPIEDNIRKIIDNYMDSHKLSAGSES